jgi:hypothetical protein
MGLSELYCCEFSDTQEYFSGRTCVNDTGIDLVIALECGAPQSPCGVSSRPGIAQRENARTRVLPPANHKRKHGKASTRQLFNRPLCAKLDGVIVMVVGEKTMHCGPRDHSGVI